MQIPELMAHLPPVTRKEISRIMSDPISRRGFIEGSLAAGAGLLASASPILGLARAPALVT
jgi:hypothetical protein